MAQYQHLHIYKAAYSLLIDLMHKTKNFPREFKYSIGEKIQTQLIEMLLEIYRANSVQDKTCHIQSVLDCCQQIEIFLRMSNDLNLISHDNYAVFVEQTCSVAKQAQGWLQAFKNRAEPVCSNSKLL